MLLLFSGNKVSDKHDSLESRTGLVMEGPGQAQRGSQQLQPPLSGGAKATNTWQDLAALVQEGEIPLHELRELMKNPAASLGSDVHKLVRSAN
jgi:hypothetical protein